MGRRVQVEKEKQRALTAAEERRLERFERMCANLVEQGYRKRELTISIVRANVVVLIAMIPVFAAGFSAFALANPQANYGVLQGWGLLALAVGFVALTVAHELIHGLTWSRFSSGGMGDIEFGFMKKYLTPYCTCTAPLERRGYIAGTLMPLLVLGVVPTVVAVAGGWLWLLVLGLVMILAAGGDVLIVVELLKHKSTGVQQLVCDHPTQGGCVVFER